MCIHRFGEALLHHRAFHLPFGFGSLADLPLHPEIGYPGDPRERSLPIRLHHRFLHCIHLFIKLPFASEIREFPEDDALSNQTSAQTASGAFPYLLLLDLIQSDRSIPLGFVR